MDIIYQIGLSLIPGFQLLENDLKIYRALIMYFHDDPEFEKLNSNYGLDKGILLRGNIGTGKSRVFEIFNQYVKKNNPLKKYRIVKTSDVTDDFYENGIPAIYKHTSFSFKKDLYNNADYKFPLTKCYDDLGLEPKIVKCYGNERNVMADILLKRYDFFIMYGMKTFITTNYNADDIELNYGDRLRSRLREMCNDLVYEGKDRRR
ncbi:MAG: hypothetical protein A2W99_13260 [Bacteroidetes bacterium GWF2_33_16]|nr:MAG: hypothetical protein A2X00_01015 [Bacteroidetes bacterium GWE2_32_14]OFY06646.1 MAG: hypothetical protein A2W99_13260 [Bacteroidetes bacterium GWF2_33_16]